VKAVDVIVDDSALCKVSANPNFRALGKKLGPRLKAVQNALAAFGPAELDALARDGKVELEGETLTAEDILLTREASVGGAVESQNGLTVLLDTNITPELHHEGLARELVNRVQNLRKTAGLDVSQRIRLRVHATGQAAAMLENAALRELVARETLAVSLESASM